MAKYSEAQAGYIKTYLSKFEDMRFRVAPADKDRYKKAAVSSGMSMAKFIVAAIEEKIARDQQ